MSSTKAKAPPKKFGGAFFLLYHTHMDCVCCVCIVCCERDMYIHDVYILMNWEGPLHKGALGRQTA